MKLFAVICATCLGAVAFAPMTATAKDKDKTKPADGAKPEKAAKKPKLNHVVAFKFKDSATKEQIKEIEDAFRALKTKIPQQPRGT
jgi:hypothetical protein